MYQPKSVQQIIQECNVSHSTAYIKMRWLVRGKLLENTQNGRKANLFQTIKYEHNNLLIEAEQNFDTPRKITEN